MTDKSEKEPDKRRCENCGKQDDTVRYTTNPFAEEVYGEKVYVTICSQCYQELCDDIQELTNERD